MDAGNTLPYVLESHFPSIPRFCFAWDGRARWLAGLLWPSQEMGPVSIRPAIVPVFFRTRCPAPFTCDLGVQASTPPGRSFCLDRFSNGGVHFGHGCWELGACSGGQGTRRMTAPRFVCLQGRAVRGRDNGMHGWPPRLGRRLYGICLGPPGCLLHWLRELIATGGCT